MKKNNKKIIYLALGICSLLIVTAGAVAIVRKTFFAKPQLCNESKQIVLFNQEMPKNKMIGPFAADSKHTLWAYVTRTTNEYSTNEVFGHLYGPGGFYYVRAGQQPSLEAETFGTSVPNDPYVRLTTAPKRIILPAGQWDMYATDTFGLKLISCTK